MKALAKHFTARLLIVDSLLLPGVSFLDIMICTLPSVVVLHILLFLVLTIKVIAWEEISSVF